MHIHILGICGTFMGSLAVLAKELGHNVTGSDTGVYPPMSTQLEEQGIQLSEGFSVDHLQPHPDLVVVGNALSRGNPAVEYVLDQGLPYCSGPQWLAQYVLKDRWVLAVAGTHGKTTTSAMLAWILEHAGMAPGFLIGGVLNNFPASARLGDTPFFVVEADEYDSAFFDKRSKFVHYAPRTLILNNLEFDHADIFDDLSAIQRQFHHLVRTVPGSGLIIWPSEDDNISQVLQQGCWSQTQTFAVGDASLADKDRDGSAVVRWHGEPLDAQGSCFEVSRVTDDGEDAVTHTVNWSLNGLHNVANAVAAIAAAQHVGVTVAVACEALEQFRSVKRRMELLGTVNHIAVYDDFAHHPTAIETTLHGLKQQLVDQPGSRLIAIIEPRSATMKMGVHKDTLAHASRFADHVIWYHDGTQSLDIDAVIAASETTASKFSRVEDIVAYLLAKSVPGDHIVLMSNGGFGGIHKQLLSGLQAQFGELADA